jgi:hypothetical protein
LGVPGPAERTNGGVDLRENDKAFKRVEAIFAKHPIAQA